ncbi:hypothetical protein [Lysobacter gummosus]|uniref:hypothetical protein n=1 Tax=Lysobacter gummosus TaxID=262324 RepID=UPI00362E581B
MPRSPYGCPFEGFQGSASRARRRAGPARAGPAAIAGSPKNERAGLRRLLR